jgi:hypothetical protein
MDGEINIPEGTVKMKCVFEGKEELVILRWTLIDAEKVKEIDPDNIKECREYLLNKMQESLADNETALRASKASDDDIVNFINAYLNAFSRIKAEYERTVDKSTIKRFIVACKMVAEEDINSVFREIMPSLERLYEAGQYITSHIASDFSRVLNTLEIWNQYYEEERQKWIQSMKYALALFSEAIKNSQISDEERKRLERNYKKWGDFGWTYIPHLTVELLDSDPVDVKRADKKAYRYTSKEVVNAIWGEMREMENVKKSDLKELERCFEGEMYKATCMMAFGMIDSKIVQAQEIEKRTPGNKGRSRVLGEIESKMHGRDELFLELYARNIMACLDKIYKENKGFTTQPTVINRHFIIHGMLYRKVSRKDAIKVILLAYNVHNLMLLLSVGKQ